jgi:hypothetical protein
MNTFALLIILHVFIALSSIAYSTYIFFAPTKDRLRVNFALIIMTLLSGSYLVAAKPAHMLESCTMGLLYLGFVSVGVVAARRKLARQENYHS